MNEGQDELECYLNTDPDYDADDPIQWWQEHEHIYPWLARMALDFLTIPGIPHCC